MGLPTDDEWVWSDIDDELYLAHIGTPHEGYIPHSGRWPYGSGEHAFQRDHTFYGEYNKRKAKGMTEKQIAEELGCVDERTGKASTSILRDRYAVAKAERRAAMHETVRRMHDEEGKGWSEIGRELGIRDTSVISLYDEEKAKRNALTKTTADILKDYVDKYRYVDISAGVSDHLGVTQTRLNNAVEMLKSDGYKEQKVFIPQLGTNHNTTITVITPGDVDYAELSEHKYDIRYPKQDVKVYNGDGDLTSIGIKHPTPVDPKRIQVVYAEEGGTDKDGLIELRRNVPDLSLGASQYAQVRINVDDTHYIKGMAVFNDDLPPGIDIRFNTNKHVGTPMMSDDPEAKQVLKPMERNKITGEIDWTNPFGSSIPEAGQIENTDKNGNKILSACNVVRFEGEWQTWDKNLASQFLSKQPKQLAERQLSAASKDKRDELDGILALTEPEIRKKLLISYADKCDALASELKAAPFAGQQYHVLLPVPELKDNECYCPTYQDGQRVSLIRYPHGGTFEIAELTVHNNGSPAEKIVNKLAPDAICINHNVADRLSGADFDGDAVIVIPLSDSVRVRSTPPLEGLKGFDPKEAYPMYEGMKVASDRVKEQQMGIVSNLIADMTIKGASDDQLARAVRHSMVVIDSHKHKLNWKQSEKDNDIAELMELYQKKGEKTIITRAGADVRVPITKEWFPSSKSIGPNGEKILSYPTSGNTYMEGTLKGIPLNDGRYVSVRKEKKTGLYYYTKEDPATGKKVRVHVTDDDFPDTIEALKSQKSAVTVNKDKNDGRMYYLRTDPTSGKKVRQYITEDDLRGPLREKPRLQTVTQMSTESDPYKLTSGGSKENPGTIMEGLYAKFATDMKSYANEARKAWVDTPTYKQDKEAAKQYKDEIKSLNDQLLEAKMNAPKERQAHLLGNRHVAIVKEANPGMSSDDISKLRGRTIVAARKVVGAKKKRIVPTEKEWEAIEHKAISATMLREILDNSDLDAVKKLATPKECRTVSPSMKALARSMASTVYYDENGKPRRPSRAEIADRLGVSVSTVTKILKGEV